MKKLEILHGDFETFSRAPLKKCGGYRYAADVTTEVLCFCWKIDDEPIETWIPCISIADAERFDELPEDWWYGIDVPAPLNAALKRGAIFMAHNASFERAIWEKVVVPRHGGARTLPRQYACTATRAAASGLPRALAPLAAALGASQQKDTEGAKLLKMFAMPRKPTKADARTRIMPLDDVFNFIRLVKYCQQDVRTEHNVDKEIPHLSDLEQRLFAFDMVINERGFHIDIPLVRKAKTVLAKLEADIVKEVQSVTMCTEYPEGLRPTQRDKMLKHFRGMGVELENLQADHVKKYMKKHIATLPAPARRLLQLRMEAGKSSTKKLASMLEFCHDDHIARGTLMMYGAHTGRWCIAEDSLVLVRDAQGNIRKRKIQHVRSNDMLWDGVEWVEHAGVVASGEKEIVDHDGVSASADHEVWVSPQRKMRLEDAKKQGKFIWKSVPWCTYALIFKNGKRYIGISNRPTRRYADHIALGTGPAVSAAVAKHGAPKLTVLNWYPNKEAACRAEIKLVAKNVGGYNLATGGQVGPGFSEEIQRAASLKGTARMAELRKDPTFAKKLNAAISAGVRASSAHAEANRAKAEYRRGKPSKNPDAARASFKLATLARQQRSADLRELGLLKKQTNQCHVKRKIVE